MTKAQQFRWLLRDNVANYQDSIVQHLYRNLFDLLTDEQIESILNTCKEYKSEVKEWFTAFHKLIRQTDLICDLKIYKNGQLTQEEQNERHFLIQHKVISQNKPQANRLRELNNILEPKEIEHTRGFFDALLYDTICLDINDYLMKTINGIINENF